MRLKGNGKADDGRFKHIAMDPRYRGVPRSQRKIKIDNRFAAMFDDRRFKLKYAMDKRGRPIGGTTTEDLKKYYAVASSESENDGDGDASFEEEEEDVQENPEPMSESQDLEPQFAEDVASAGEDDDEDSDDEEEDSESLESTDEKEQPERDPARGIGNIETSSEEDESSEDESQGASGDEVAWGELDRDAPHSDHVSRRLALCNLDWDKLRAQDLFVLLNSFKPPGGVVHRVSVYPSEFGKARMAHEQVSGPTELVEAARASGAAEEEADAKKKREALRQYQLSRLRYYYAIAECDSAETADHLYRELDGREYESSGTCLDLRFVPDDMVFTDEPSSVADSLPNPQSYQPLTFVTSALMSVKPELTWDEGDPRRSEAMQRAFKEDSVHDDLNVYLASSSSEDEDSQEQGSDKQGLEKKASMEAQIQKYRALLKNLDQGEEKADKEEDDVEMEVTWNPGLNKQVEDMVRKKHEQPEEKTPFQEFLEKRREKRKLKRSLNKQDAQAEDSGVGKEEQDDTENSQSEEAFSDDELPSDMDLDDDFFKRSTPPKTPKRGAKNKKKTKNGMVKEGKADDEETAKSKAELELLLMDEEEDGRHHFSLKKLLEENQMGQKKRRRTKANKEGKAAQQGKPDGDDFQVDLADPRFSALYDSHHFNVDPTDSHFKKTKGMEALLAEKQKRRLAAPEEALRKAVAATTNAPRASPASQQEPDPPLSPKPVAAPKPSQSLSSLASSLKLKVQHLKSKPKN